jgi:hypothetical protein
MSLRASLSSAIHGVLLAAVLGCTGATEARAQGDDVRAVLVATLVDVDSSLRATDDARVHGPIAFDARVLRSTPGPAHPRWPDATTPRWTGFAWDAARPAGEVAGLLDAANGERGPVRWLPCAAPPAARPCHLGEFPVVVSVSRPLIDGDMAQVLVLVGYRSSIRLHPNAFMGNVVRLQRVDGRWKSTHWHNQAAN